MQDIHPAAIAFGLCTVPLLVIGVRIGADADSVELIAFGFKTEAKVPEFLRRGDRALFVIDPQPQLFPKETFCLLKIPCSLCFGSRKQNHIVRAADKGDPRLLLITVQR